jgi:hypothetical protein
MDAFSNRIDPRGNMMSVGKGLFAFVIVMIGALGLLMSACGGFFSFLALLSLFNGGTQDTGDAARYGQAAIGVAISSLVIGFLITVASWSILRGIAPDDEDLTASKSPTPVAAAESAHQSDKDESKT